MQALQTSNAALLALGGAAALGGVLLLSRLSSRQSEPNGASGDQPRRPGRVAQWAERQGVSPGKCARFLVVHELLGVAVLGASTVGCLYAKPLERLTDILQGNDGGAGLKGMVDAGMATAERKVGALLARLRIEDVSPAFATRLTRAWAEGMVVRSLLSPLLFPLKMWTAFYLVS